MPRAEPSSRWLASSRRCTSRRSSASDIESPKSTGTGRFRRIAELEKHRAAGADRVLLTVPCKDELAATVVLGVNDHVLANDPKIISNASCTTHCVAPIAKVLHDAIGLERGFLTTVHAYTSDQRLIDSPTRRIPGVRATRR